MAQKIQVNPFAPGPGMMPAYFSGRKKETKLIDTVLNRARSAYKPKKGDTVIAGPLLGLVGPRGIGKTLLLNIAANMASEKKIQVVKLTESHFRSNLSNLIPRLLPKGKIAGFLKKHGISIKGKIPLFLEVGAQPFSDAVPQIITEAISERLKSGPLLLTIDEAHALQGEMLGELYQEIQIYMGEKQPLGVILAGTPSLKRHRRKEGLTFSERTEFLEFNLLSDAETSDAFVNAFLSVGMTVEPKALEKLTKWSDNYPYFVQMAGFHTWECIEHTANKTNITEDDVNLGIRQATLNRISFYKERYVEIFNLEILKQAVQVANLVSSEDKQLDQVELATRLAGINDGMDTKRAAGIVVALLQNGFIWENVDVIEPGIPSLFDYIKRKRSSA